MPSANKIWKPLDALTAEDLQAYPLWTCPVVDEDDESLPEDWDESWLTPVEAGSLGGELDEEPLWAATRFRTAAGRELVGVLSADGGEIYEDEGALLADGEWVHLARSRVGRDQMAAALGASVAEIFPLAYEVLAKAPLLSPASRTGVIE